MSDLFGVGAAAEAAGEAVGGLTAGGTPGEALRDRNDRLERRLEKLSLVCQALWGLVRDKTGSTEADLAGRVMDLDLSDGKLDGRRAPGLACEACGRVSARRHARCLYCEKPRKGASAFDQI